MVLLPVALSADKLTAKYPNKNEIVTSLAAGALALAKFPIVQAIKLDKALPLIYGYCGYRAGETI